MQQYVPTTYNHITVPKDIIQNQNQRDIRIQSAIVCCYGGCKTAEKKYTL